MKINYNIYLENQKYIQAHIRKFLHAHRLSTSLDTSIILGRAGVHNCYQNNMNLYREKLNTPLNRKLSPFDITVFTCTKRCKLKTRIKYSAYLFVIVVNSCLHMRKKTKLLPNVLIFANPNRTFRNSQLYDFLAEKRIREHLKNQDLRILNQGKFKFWDNSGQNVKNCISIPLYLMNNYLKFLEKFILLKSVFKNFLKLLTIRGFDPIQLCFKEFILEIDLYKKINFIGEIDLIYTQSNLRKLSPISYRNDSRYTINNIMIWYSSNNIVPNKINEKSSEYHESYLSLEKIDRHLVWDEAMKKSLSKITRKPIYAIGSLMFYPKIETIKKQKTETINIVVFDITPPKSKINTEENFGYESQAIETLKQIINVIEKIKVRSQKDLVLTLKSKREFGRAHSKMYRHYVKLLKRKRVIHLLDPKTNLYDVIGGADLVICFPWTSPGIIAVELGVPCIYYISDREKIWNLENPRKFNLCRTESELYSSLERNLEL